MISFVTLGPENSAECVTKVIGQCWSELKLTMHFVSQKKVDRWMDGWMELTLYD